MANQVYANGREISCKAADGKSIAAFPDVCFTPPQTPATPPGVPIPYPNTAMASDTTDGSKSVKISGKEIMLKNKSYFKKSSGDEAGSAPKKGVVTSTNTGKAYFASYSMDVKFEEENVVRHLDITTHNHSEQNPPQTPPMPYTDAQTTSSTGDDEKCRLRPYKEGCPAPKTPHHCVPDHCFRQKGNGPYYNGAIKHSDGLCICVEGSTKSTSKNGSRIKKKNFSNEKAYEAELAEHGRIHLKFDKLEKGLGADGTPKQSAKLGALEDAAASSVSDVTGCDEANLKKQMRAHHDKHGLSEETKLRADPFGHKESPPPGQLGTKLADIALE